LRRRWPAGSHFEEAIENIISVAVDAAQRGQEHESVTVVCDPADYQLVLQAMESPATLLGSAPPRAQGFSADASYDAAISRYLEGQLAEPDLAAVAGFRLRSP